MKNATRYDTQWFMNCRDITFISDGYQLSGTLHLSEASDPPVIIGSHGLLSSADSPKQIALANECARAGMAYFRYNHRGCGNSQGNFETDTSLESRCRDMLHAVNCLRSFGLSCNRIGLFGSSMGGAVCISMATELSADAMIVNAAPVKLDRTRRIPGVSEPLKSDLKFDLSDKLNRLHHILIFHGEADDVVPVAHSHLIHKQAQQPKRLRLFKNGDHIMSNPNHQATFIRDSTQWFRRYLLSTHHELNLSQKRKWLK